MLTKYLNVTEIDSALKGLAKGYPGITELIPLPHTTSQGQPSNALRIGTNKAADGVLFIACAHAREWGGAEICVSFATDLLESYTTKAGRTYGGKSFTALQVQAIIEGLNVIVFPCVNPDGRRYDQKYDKVMWRKNRNPKESGGIADRIGVDINRNYSFLWDFKKAFDPESYSAFGFTGLSTTVASEDPSDELYHGSAPDSEAETRNVESLFDAYPRIRWFLDIHSYSGDVMWSWGDDTDQTTDPSMNFRNPAYDGKRGVEGGYGETSIPPT